jgi:hypothetical protein
MEKNQEQVQPKQRVITPKDIAFEQTDNKTGEVKRMTLEDMGWSYTNQVMPLKFRTASRHELQMRNRVCLAFCNGFMTALQHLQTQATETINKSKKKKS